MLDASSPIRAGLVVNRVHGGGGHAAGRAAEATSERRAVAAVLQLPVAQHLRGDHLPPPRAPPAQWHLRRQPHQSHRRAGAHVR